MTDPETFLKYDYAETKDLLKTFITLISATLVVSLTFSEKIIRFNQAERSVRSIFLASWVLFILALTSAGLGMAFVAAAAGTVLYGSIPLFDLGFARLAFLSWTFVMLAGATYVAGLIALAISAARGMVPREETG